MKVALLIHVHTNPDQVAKLVSRLQHPAVDVYINVDAKADIDEFKSRTEGVQYIKNRVEVHWGRFSQVQQIINSFREIISGNTSYSHVLFISGSDYPIQPIGNVVDFLAKNIDKSFIDYHKLGDDDWSNLMKRRYEYWFFLPEKDIRSNPFVKKALLKFGFKRRYPFREVYYGSCWFCLSTDVIKYLLQYIKENPKTVSFFQYSGCSDELFIQSLLLNSPWRATLVNEVFHYFDWSDGGKSPKILTVDDFSKIQKSGAWFARKLDTNVDSHLFELIDNNLNK